MAWQAYDPTNSLLYIGLAPASFCPIRYNVGSAVHLGERIRRS